MRIQIWASWWQFHRFDSHSSKNIQKFTCVRWIAIMDQKTFCHEESIHSIRQIARDLTHPQSIWLVGNASHLHSPSRNVHEEKDDEPRQAGTCPDLHGEEVRRDDLVPVALQEF